MSLGDKTGCGTSVWDGDNVVLFPRDQTTLSTMANNARDDDELFRDGMKWITKGLAAASMPTMTEMQEFFHRMICGGASAMLKVRLIAHIVNSFGDKFGGKRALSKTWTDIAKQVADERVSASDNPDAANESPAPEEVAAMRYGLWASVRELAEAPDLMDRVVKQVQSLGVVNEDELITLVYISATSRVLQQPLNPLVKGSSSGGKNYTTTKRLELVGPDFVNYLTTSSALSLVCDERPPVPHHSRRF